MKALEKKWERLFDTACKIGERNSKQANEWRDVAIKLRRVIASAYVMLQLENTRLARKKLKRALDDTSKDIT